ncbi:hypothetical protein [Nodosilinea sp. LEGE 07088]|uniref:hypothetical protein n=1 Tax=Nodosilinea sp. LEGE 07088 TaxID=2777968 RepID=UPI001D153EAC|nr:hypothetical protein [Nodosilinea sp. LEGE 07088]
MGSISLSQQSFNGINASILAGLSRFDHFHSLTMRRSLQGKKDFREEQGQGIFTEPAKDVAWLLYAAMTRAIQAICV